jgi:hypothetical protein
MPRTTAQIKVQLGSVEVTDTDRRAIAWEHDGDMIDGEWVLNVSRTHGQLATREECRKYIRKHGEHGVTLLVRDYLNAGGLTATQERQARAADRDMQDIRARLEYLRGELRGERISYSELAELQGLAEHIDRTDVELLQAAGIPEHP